MNRRQFFTPSLLAMLAPSLLAADARWSEGAALPSLATFGLEGSLPALKGKVVLLDFWASWCSPCKASFPTLNGLHERLGGRGLVVLGINVDENPADRDRFLKSTPASFRVVRDAGQKLVAAANVQTMPTSFIIDRAGVIRHVHSGFHKKDAATLEQQITALL
jgi:thiol-disulfide isomerase/thioredoxin